MHTHKHIHINHFMFWIFFKDLSQNLLWRLQYYNMPQHRNVCNFIQLAIMWPTDRIVWCSRNYRPLIYVSPMMYCV